jgi:plasmid stabilization system protein ParE
MTRLIIEPLAEADMNEAFAWYEQQESGLGDKFKSALNLVLQQIARFPESCPKHFGARRAVERKFKFNVIYEYAEETVFVTAVVHGSRDPSVLKSRISERTD